MNSVKYQQQSRASNRNTGPLAQRGRASGRCQRGTDGRSFLQRLQLRLQLGNLLLHMSTVASIPNNASLALLAN